MSGATRVRRCWKRWTRSKTTLLRSLPRIAVRSCRKVMFIATANMLEPIIPALRDRMEIIELSGYTEADKFTLPQKYLVPRQLAEHGLKPGQLSIQSAASPRLSVITPVKPASAPSNRKSPPSAGEPPVESWNARPNPSASRRSQPQRLSSGRPNFSTKPSNKASNAASPLTAWPGPASAATFFSSRPPKCPAEAISF